MFDVVSDPLETTDLAPSSPGDVAALTQALREWPFYDTKHWPPTISDSVQEYDSPNMFVGLPCWPNGVQPPYACRVADSC